MPLELIFLGTGTSAGIPMIGCACDVCRSTDPRDHRTRPSVLIRYPDESETIEGRRQFIVDTAFEMRLQLIRHDIRRIDGVFYTHSHADHLFGLDDLRRFNAMTDAPIEIRTELETMQKIQRVFPYIFEAHKNVQPSFVAQLLPMHVEAAVPLHLHGATWTPLRLMHGRLPILGFRVDHDAASLAYCTDVSSFPPDTYALLQDLDVLVIDGLRYRHHPTHMTVNQALAEIEQIQPKRAYLTHIAHDIKHADLESELPEHVYLSFDGLTVAIGD